MLSPTLFLPYLLLALVVTAVAARRAKTPARKRWITIGLLAFFFAFAHVDDILGGIQHKWLCREEAGFFVYKSVKLPPELYDANGKPRFMTDRGPNKQMLAPYLDFRTKVIRDHANLFLKIDKHIFQVVSRDPETILGEIVSFSAWPSEFIPSFSHVGAYGCLNTPEELRLWHEWESRLFALK